MTDPDVYRRKQRAFQVVSVILAVLLLAVGVATRWGAATLLEGRKPQTSEVVTVVVTAPCPEVTAAVVVVTATSAPQPTPTLAPTATPEPPTPTPAPTPFVVVGADGANVRDEPDLNGTRLGFLDPGAEAPLIACEGEWCQISYEGQPGWVYAPLVTVSTVEPTETATPTP